jgi:hypothetical protein
VVERKILNLAVPPVETRFEVLPEVGGEARSTIFFVEWRTVSSKPGADLLGNRRFESISLQQTVRLSPAATFERQEPGLSLQVCEARLTTGSAETQRAFHCAPTGGNVSAGPNSSTAVRLMRSAAMPRRSERNQEFSGFSVGSL